VGCDDGFLNVFDTDQWRVVGRTAAGQGYLTAVAYSPDGAYLATTGHSRLIKLWDATTLEPRGELRGHLDVIISLAFSPDGRRLASGGKDQRVILWDLASLEPLLTVGRHKHWVWQVRFSPDGKTLYSVSADRTVRAWRTE
jgi:WD40 repeat protein